MQSAQVQIRTLDCFIVRFLRGGSRHHHDVQSTGQCFIMVPETFPDQPGDPVTNYAVSYFFADGYADPVARKARPLHIHYQLPVGMGFSRPVYGLEIRIFLDTWKFPHVSPQSKKGHNRL